MYALSGQTLKALVARDGGTTYLYFMYLMAILEDFHFLF